MPYELPPLKAWKDQLGPTTLRKHVDNLAWLRWIAAAEHIVSTGEHNAIEVARVVRSINGAGTTVAPSSTDITAVSRPATGRYVLTLAGGRFTTDMRIEVNVRTDGSKPFFATYQILSATSVEIYIWKLSTALGVAGNTWAAANQEFDVAIHSTPLTVGTWSALPVAWARGDYFDDRATGWNVLVQEAATMQAMLTGSHTSAGVHNVHEVAKEWGQITYEASSYTVQQGTFSSSVWSSAGVVVVTHATYGATTTSYFVQPDYERLTEQQGTAAAGAAALQFISNVKPTSATTCTVYSFKFDASTNTWNVGDTDFFLTAHGD